MKIKNIIFFVILLQSNTFSSFYSDLIEGFLIGFTIQNLTFTKLSNFLELEKKLKLPQLKLDTHKSSLFDSLSQAETKYSFFTAGIHFLISFFIGAIIGYRIDQRQADAQKRKKLEAEMDPLKVINMLEKKENKEKIANFLQGGTLFTVDLLSTFFPCLKTNEHLYLISNTNEYSNNNRNRALLPA
jgi:uncharacterized membrane-anchored protein YhcB (DUF1043 family)